MIDSRILAEKLKMSEAFINDICFKELPNDAINQGGWYLITDEAASSIKEIRNKFKDPYLRTAEEIDNEYINKICSLLSLNNILGIRRTLENISDTSGYVYIMKDLNSGLIKIGRSKNPELRLLSLTTANPNLKLSYAKYFDDCIEAENNAHKLLNEYRILGEWFEMDVSLAKLKIEQL